MSQRHTKVGTDNIMFITNTAREKKEIDKNKKIQKYITLPNCILRRMLVVTYKNGQTNNKIFNFLKLNFEIKINKPNKISK